MLPMSAESLARALLTKTPTTQEGGGKELRDSNNLDRRRSPLFTPIDIDAAEVEAASAERSAQLETGSLSHRLPGRAAREQARLLSLPRARTGQ